MLTTRARGLSDLPDVEPDALLALIAMAAADPREDKIDVGVGVFRDGEGRTPILKVTKEAEQRLLDTQETKAYLGGRGDKRFAELIGPVLLGDLAADPAVDGVQTPGGCGALRLGFQLLAEINPEARVLDRHADLAEPRADHPRGRARDRSNILITSAARRSIRFDAMMDAIGQRARRRHRAAPRLLPQSDRRRPRLRPMARGDARGERARADPVRRHRLSGARARARRGCGRAARICSPSARK